MWHVDAPSTMPLYRQCHKDFSTDARRPRWPEILYFLGSILLPFASKWRVIKGSPASTLRVWALMALVPLTNATSEGTSACQKAISTCLPAFASALKLGRLCCTPRGRLWRLLYPYPQRGSHGCLEHIGRPSRPM